jgi:hypothetical protein
MGPVYGQCQIVRMLHNLHNACNAFDRVVEPWDRFGDPNLYHVVDHEIGHIAQQLAKVTK